MRRASLPRRFARAVRLTPTLLKRAVVQAWDHRILGLSAETAFWQMLSLPSLFLALIGLLGYASSWFGPGTVDRTETQIVNTLGKAFTPQVVDKVIAPILNEVLHGDRADIVSIGFVLALWAGSSAMATFVNTVTIAYRQRDLRGAVRSRLLALWMFLATVVLGVFLLPMLVLGPDLLQRPFPAGVRADVGRLIDIGYYPVLVILLMLGLITFYWLAPPRRLPWHRGAPGAVFAVLIFLAGSAILREYVTYILDQNHAYATLGSPIAALLFFYVLALGVLLGAEFNAAIEAHAPAPASRSLALAHRLDPRRWGHDRHHDAEADVAAGAAPSAPAVEPVAATPPVERPSAGNSRVNGKPGGSTKPAGNGKPAVNRPGVAAQRPPVSRP